GRAPVTSRSPTSYPVKTGHYLVGNEGIYKVGEFLGEGGFGKVAKCTKLGCQDFFAIKIVKHVESGKKEFEALEIIKDLDPVKNNLVKLYECFLFENVICLDFEPTHLCKLRPVAQQMFQALSALKSISVAHMDIKLDNIMYVDEESSKIKLIDFGLALKTKELLTGSDIQVIPFRAPEVILGLPMDESIDMWALGIVFATMCRGDFPFPCGTEYETIRGLVQIFGSPEQELLTAGMYTEHFFTLDEGRGNTSWRLKTPDEFTRTSGEQLEHVNHVANLDEMTEIHREQFELFDDDDHRAFNDLLKRMLEVDPMNRITPSQALEHDFITMRHLSGESQASYAATAKIVMRKTQLKVMEVDPPAPEHFGQRSDSEKISKMSEDLPNNQEIPAASKKPKSHRLL
uniref:Protein kinase domain-containing protein n=1 Tax=Oryzias latipes TaxID=8090 RepID=A0A3B3ILW4_ORYLA